MTTVSSCIVFWLCNELLGGFNGYVLPTWQQFFYSRSKNFHFNVPNSKYRGSGKMFQCAATHDPAQARPNTFSLLPVHAVPTFIGVFLTFLLQSLGN